jgi:nucleoside phosphorylase
VSLLLGDVVAGTRLHDFGVTAVLPDGKRETAVSGGPIHRAVQTALANLRATKSLLRDWYSEAAIGRRPPTVSLEDRNFFGNENWNEKIERSLLPFTCPTHYRPPLVTAATLGSGNALMQDPVAFQRWLDFARDLKAVEMELPGVFEAVRSVRGDRPVLAIRGISDIVGFRRHPDWTEYACHVAASFAKAFLTSGLLHIPPKPKGGLVSDMTRSPTDQSRRTSRGAQPFEPDGMDLITDWAILGSSRTHGLAELRLHQPRPGNVPGTYYVEATLRLGRGEYDYEDHTVSIGLREAFLSLDSSSYQAAQRSMIGERAAHADFQPDVGGVKITGPRKGGCLVGEPLDEEYLAIIEPTEEGDETVTVSLHAGRLSFEVALVDRQDGKLSIEATPINKRVVLNTLIYERRERDPQGRVILAGAQMRRKPRI